MVRSFNRNWKLFQIQLFSDGCIVCCFLLNLKSSTYFKNTASTSAIPTWSPTISRHTEVILWLTPNVIPRRGFEPWFLKPVWVFWTCCIEDQLFHNIATFIQGHSCLGCIKIFPVAIKIQTVLVVTLVLVCDAKSFHDVVFLEGPGRVEHIIKVDNPLVSIGHHLHYQSPPSWCHVTIHWKGSR